MGKKSKVRRGMLLWGKEDYSGKCSGCKQTMSESWFFQEIISEVKNVLQKRHWWQKRKYTTPVKVARLGKKICCICIMDCVRRK